MTVFSDIWFSSSAVTISPMPSSMAEMEPAMQHVREVFFQPSATSCRGPSFCGLAKDFLSCTCLALLLDRECSDMPNTGIGVVFLFVSHGP